MRLPVTAIVYALCLVSSVSAAESPAPNPPWNGIPLRTTIEIHAILGDPINVAFEGSRASIIAAFNKIGWVVADPLNRHNDLRLARAALHHGSYPTAPVSRQFLFGRIEDFAVERELGSVSRRDHARFWDTGKQDKATHLELWIGAASRDIGITVHRVHHVLLGTTHRIDGNLDAERDLVVTSLQKARLVQTVLTEPGAHITHGVTGGGSHFSTDGKVALMVLKSG